MRRREAISILLAAVAARGARPLGSFFSGTDGAAILLDVRTRRIIASHHDALVNHYLAPPGSAIKPFVLDALLRSGKLRANESYLCPGQLRIGERSLNCSHPQLDSPLRPDTALAYSCNCFVAHVAERFAPGELARRLKAGGITERVQPMRGGDGIRLQALGEDGIAITLAELAMGFRHLALSASDPVRTGLEEAVEFGTAQKAQVAGMKVRGQDGAARGRPMALESPGSPDLRPAGRRNAWSP